MLDPIQTLNSRHFNPLLRKTEIWLNYAEAANEAWGPEGKGDDCKYSAYDVLKSYVKIRWYHRCYLFVRSSF